MMSENTQLDDSTVRAKARQAVTVHRAFHDWSDDRALSTSVAYALADARGVDPTDLVPRLNDVIDPDALDDFLRGATAGTEVVFPYDDWWVTVSGDGELEISDRGTEGATAR